MILCLLLVIATSGADGRPHPELGASMSAGRYLSMRLPKIEPEKINLFETNRVPYSLLDKRIRNFVGYRTRRNCEEVKSSIN